MSVVTQAARELFGNIPAGTPEPSTWALRHPVAYSLAWIVLIIAVFAPRRPALPAGGPATKAWTFDRCGPPDVLSLTDVDTPVPGVRTYDIAEVPDALRHEAGGHARHHDVTRRPGRPVIRPRPRRTGRVA